MAVSDHLSAVKETRKRRQADADRGRQWLEAGERLHRAKNAMPHGTTPNNWTARFREWLAAAKEFESLGHAKPSNLLDLRSLRPWSRIRAFVSDFESSDDPIQAIAGSLVRTSIVLPAKLCSELAKLLAADVGESDVRQSLAAFAEITYYEMTDWPLKAPRPAFDRDHEFLRWYEASGTRTYHSQAGIRDRWNKLHPTKKVNIDTVKTGIRKAQQELRAANGITVKRRERRKSPKKVSP
jgi:hypothetical protein